MSLGQTKPRGGPHQLGLGRASANIDPGATKDSFALAHPGSFTVVSPKISNPTSIEVDETGSGPEGPETRLVHRGSFAGPGLEGPPKSCSPPWGLSDNQSRLRRRSKGRPDPLVCPCVPSANYNWASSLLSYEC